MINPHFEQAPSHWPPDYRGKWWCSNGENNKKCRYMSPIGWKETAHWYKSKEEAEADFNKYEKEKRDKEITQAREELEKAKQLFERITFLNNENSRMGDENTKLKLENIQLKMQIWGLYAENEKLKQEIVDWEDWATV